MEKNMCGPNCGCYGGHFRLMKVLVKLLILGLVFCFGFHLGEITGFIKAEIGHTVGLNNFYGVGMMRGSVPVPPPPIPTVKK